MGELQEEVANGKNATKPKGIARRPVLKGLKEPILMCMCYAAHCLGQFDQATTKCPIKCLKDNTQPTASATNSDDDESEKKIESERYEFIGHPKKKCTCPICNCKCSYACYVDDVAKILLARKVEGDEQSRKKEDLFDTHTTTPSFLRNIMGDAMKVGYLNMQLNYEKNKRDEVGVSILSDESIQKRGASVACPHAAVSIASSQQKLTLGDRKLWREGFGSPTTLCFLPSGDTFDTRTIAGDNKHSTNNRLGVEPELEFKRSLPGMKTNLEIDFASQSDAFIDIIEATATTSKSKILDKTSYKNPIEIESDSHESHCDMMLKKPSVDGLVQKMHERILRRAHRHLSIAIESRMKDDDSLKKEIVKQLKGTVRSLEKSEEQNTHLNCIKSVTEDGRRLLEESIDHLDSKEVLERVQIFHEAD